MAELEYGISKSSRKEQNRKSLRDFVLPLEILPFDSSAAKVYGDVRSMLEKKGQIIGSFDLLIAAHAVSVGAILVTNNEREFSRIPRLEVENWLR